MVYAVYRNDQARAVEIVGEMPSEVNPPMRGVSRRNRNVTVLSVHGSGSFHRLFTAGPPGSARAPDRSGECRAATDGPRSAERADAGRWTTAHAQEPAWA